MPAPTVPPARTADAVLARIATVLGDCTSGNGPAAPPPAPLAAVLAAFEDASAGLRDRAAYCEDCRASERGRCPEDAGRLARAEEYDALAEQVRRGQFAVIAVLPSHDTAWHGAQLAASGG